MMDTKPRARAEIAVKLVQGDNPTVEQGLRSAFEAAIASDSQPTAIATHAAQMLGSGCLVTLEADRGDWSRYRVAIRGHLLGQGPPVTIATVELTRTRSAG